MKLEFLTDNTGYLNEHSRIYITKGEFTRTYEADRKKAFHEFIGILEMFQSPACFSQPIKIEVFDKLYEHLKKSTYVGLLLSYGDDECSTLYGLVHRNRKKV